jgi:hypothetical protein
MSNAEKIHKKLNDTIDSIELLAKSTRQKRVDLVNTLNFAKAVAYESDVTSHNYISQSLNYGKQRALINGFSPNDLAHYKFNNNGWYATGFNHNLTPISNNRFMYNFIDTNFVNHDFYTYISDNNITLTDLRLIKIEDEENAANYGIGKFGTKKAEEKERFSFNISRLHYPEYYLGGGSYSLVDDNVPEYDNNYNYNTYNIGDLVYITTVSTNPDEPNGYMVYKYVYSGLEEDWNKTTPGNETYWEPLQRTYFQKDVIEPNFPPGDFTIELEVLDKLIIINNNTNEIFGYFEVIFEGLEYNYDWGARSNLPDQDYTDRIMKITNDEFRKLLGVLVRDDLYIADDILKSATEFSSSGKANYEDWDSNEWYVINDKVLHGGLLYYLYNETGYTGNEEPGVDTDFWEQVPDTDPDDEYPDIEKAPLFPATIKRITKTEWFIKDNSVPYYDNWQDKDNNWAIYAKIKWDMGITPFDPKNVLIEPSNSYDLDGWLNNANTLPWTSGSLVSGMYRESTSTTSTTACGYNIVYAINQLYSLISDNAVEGVLAEDTSFYESIYKYNGEEVDPSGIYAITSVTNSGNWNGQSVTIKAWYDANTNIMSNRKTFLDNKLGTIKASGYLERVYNGVSALIAKDKGIIYDVLSANNALDTLEKIIQAQKRYYWFILNTSSIL